VASVAEDFERHVAAGETEESLAAAAAGGPAAGGRGGGSSGQSGDVGEGGGN